MKISWVSFPSEYAKKNILQFSLVLIVVLESKDLQLSMIIRSFVRSFLRACVRSFIHSGSLCRVGRLAGQSALLSMQADRSLVESLLHSLFRTVSHYVTLSTQCENSKTILCSVACV